MIIKRSKETTIALAILIISATTIFAQGRGPGRMHAEMRETIHGLFDAHAQFKREVTQTETGYTSTTTSKNQEAAKLLQKHVKQMEKRLKQGFMVRRWDPAYEEFVRFYDDMDIQITNIKNGIKIQATGKTKEAREVARNHAGIISKFIKKGWEEHDVLHPAVATSNSAIQESAPKGCCLQDGEEEAIGACCRKQAPTKTAAACCKK
jgi:hypothetical protein